MTDCKHCASKIHALGLCKRHYHLLRFRKKSGLSLDISKLLYSKNYLNKCQYCDKTVKALGMCIAHYALYCKRKKNGQETDLKKFPAKELGGRKCKYCDRPHRAKGLCENHYGLVRDRKKRQLSEDLNTRYVNEKGKGHLNKDGYKLISVSGDPTRYKIGKKSNFKGQCILPEHIFVMSTYLGRPLMIDETVHHRNGVRDDNRIENLELWHRKKHPSGQRVEEKLKSYIEFIEQYGYVVEKKDDVKIS